MINPPMPLKEFLDEFKQHPDIAPLMPEARLELQEAMTKEEREGLVAALLAGIGYDASSKDIVDANGWADRAAVLIEQQAAEIERLRNILSGICCDSNPDWTEARKDMAATLDAIHSAAVLGFYGRKP